MTFAPPNWLAFSKLLADDLHLAAWLTGAAVALGAYLWWRRTRREESEAEDHLNLAP